MLEKASINYAREGQGWFLSGSDAFGQLNEAQAALYSLTVDNKRNRVLAFIGKVNLWDWAGAIPVIKKANGNIKYISGKDIDYKEIFNNEFRLSDYAVAYNTDDFDVIKKIFRYI